MNRFSRSTKSHNSKCCRNLPLACILIMMLVLIAVPNFLEELWYYQTTAGDLKLTLFFEENKQHHHQNDVVPPLRRPVAAPLTVTAQCDSSTSRCEQCYKCRPLIECQSNKDCCSFDERCTNKGYCKDTYNGCGSGGGCDSGECGFRYECDDMGCNEVEFGNGGCIGPISPVCKLVDVKG